MKITTLQAIDCCEVPLESLHPCDINRSLSAGELPVWRPPALRHEHCFIELSTDFFECSECGYQVLIETRESPDMGEGECHYLS